MESAEIKCPRCDNVVSKAHAFCPRCGGVITPEGSTPLPPPRRNDSAEFAATMVGQKFPMPTPPPPNKAAPTPPPAGAQAGTPGGGGTPARPPATPAQSYPAASVSPPASRGPMLFVAIGFLVVLVVGGLLAFLLYSFFLR